jgi:adenylate cyclase
LFGVYFRRPNLATLPFANLSGDPAQDYLADVLTDELTRVSRASLYLCDRAQHSLHIQGQASRCQGERQGLGVRYVLEGSVQPSAA